AFLDGISLSDAIKREGPMSVSRWLSLMLQACDGLDNVHRNGILHRDIKPGNFVLSRENGTEVLKLVDFGIAKISLEDQSLTKT
ncbi:protein kinase, partial [Acinetobacter baumannii]